MGPESHGPGEVQLWNTVTGSQFCTVEDHGQQGQVRPRWGPESRNPGEAQVGTTVTRSRVVSGADQNHQVQVWCRWQPNSPGPGKALVGYMRSHEVHEKLETHGIPGWRSGLAPAFGPGCDPGDPGSNPTSGSRCMEPASPSACVSASLSLCDYHK